MKIRNLVYIITIIQLLFISQLIGQDVQSSLFGEADKMIEEALSNELNLLSPGYYEKAFDDYQSAKAEYKDGANLKDIKEKIENVTKYLKVAKTKSEVSSITLKNSLSARKDAVKVEAILNAPELWLSAEEKFREAGEEVEDGDIPDAEEASKEAEELYRSAELASIKVLYLDETWKLINTAKEEDAENFAPKTLEKATALVKDAEKELSENRYDTDLPRSLAQQAKYESSHAIYLTRFGKDFEETEMTLEDLLLTYETPLKKIASHFDFDAKFDQPIENVANVVVQKIVDLKTSYQSASQDNADLKSEIKILKEELGGLSKEKSELDSKMAKLAETKAKYEKVNKLFSDTEAVIFKEGNNIFIRLISLSFPVGKSIIEPENFGLLSKVQNAIKNFPNSTVVIEGHTDSYGSDEKNMELSQERASAVKQYILANMNLDQNKVMSFGYGETKPIANNETKDGRAKNRRIDLIIQNAE